MIRASVGPLGETTLEVDGVPIENVNTFIISAIPGDLTRLWVEVLAPDGVEIVADPALIFYGYQWRED